MLQRYQRHLAQVTGRGGRPLSIATQRNRLTAVRTWFTFLMRENMILYNPASAGAAKAGEAATQAHPDSHRGRAGPGASGHKHTPGAPGSCVVGSALQHGYTAPGADQPAPRGCGARCLGCLLFGRARASRTGLCPSENGLWPGCCGIWKRPGPSWPYAPARTGCSWMIWVNSGTQSPQPPGAQIHRPGQAG